MYESKSIKHPPHFPSDCNFDFRHHSQFLLHPYCSENHPSPCLSKGLNHTPSIYIVLQLYHCISCFSLSTPLSSWRQLSSPAFSMYLTLWWHSPYFFSSSRFGGKNLNTKVLSGNVTRWTLSLSPEQYWRCFSLSWRHGGQTVFILTSSLISIRH